MDLLSPDKNHFGWIAHRSFDAYCTQHRFEHYSGILALHGMARLAMRTGNPSQLDRIRDCMTPFWEGRMTWRGNFPNYFAGGNASAYLFWKGVAPEAEEVIQQRGVEQDNRPRNADGLFCHPRYKENDRVWIDTVFAVAPFYLYSGLALNREKWVDEAVAQTLGHCRLLLCKETGLLYQCINFAGPGQFSQDHWGRGNGWGLHALAALVLDLPKSHPRRKEVERVFVSFVDAALQLQNRDGCWHQEMTDKFSYVETSGTFLILQAIAAGIEAGVLNEKYIPALWQGLCGGSAYITESFSIHNCCMGCLCPGKGTKVDYAARGSIRNDVHAFGPVTHAFEQAMAVDFSLL